MKSYYSVIFHIYKIEKTEKNCIIIESFIYLKKIFLEVK